MNTIHFCLITRGIAKKNIDSVNYKAIFVSLRHKKGNLCLSEELKKKGNYWPH